ncbi:hypothetical protein P7K49_015300, partial [Saguinus oedipus]
LLSEAAVCQLEVPQCGCSDVSRQARERPDGGSLVVGGGMTVRERMLEHACHDPG